MMTTEFADRYHMLLPDSRILCAVSGGADSMCLLHWLNGLCEERNITLFAAHFEHGLRGSESERDAEFTKQHCEEISVPIIVGHGNVASFADNNHIGLEEAARILRYRFLEETADTLHCDSIATAHNADDNAETILMNLCRGSGTRGLAGIPPVRGRLIRPLLPFARTQILEYLNNNNIPYIEDSSNREDIYTRNIDYSADVVKEIAEEMKSTKRNVPIAMIVCGIITIALIYVAKTISNYSIGISLLSTGAILVFFKLYSGVSVAVNNILLLNRVFSNTLIGIANDVIHKLFLIGVMLCVVGLIWIIYVEAKRKITKVLLLEEHSQIIR